MLRSLIKSNIQSSFPPQCSIVEILHCESCLSRTRAANHEDASSLGESSTEKFIQSLYSSRHPIQELTSLDPELSGLAYKNSISTARTARLERTDIRTDARLLSDAPDIGAIYCPLRDIFCLSIVEKLSRL